MEDLNEAKNTWWLTVQFRKLSALVGLEWSGFCVQPLSGLVVHSLVPESPQSPAPAALWSTIPPDNDNSCLFFCQQIRRHPPEEAEL